MQRPETSVLPAPNGEPPRGGLSEADLEGCIIAERYQILERLPDKGPAEVYVARQISLRRKVALEVIRLRDSRSPRVLSRFRHEARAASGLNHPNTVTIHDFGHTKEGLLYVATELLSGSTLQHRIGQRGALPMREAVRIGLQICASLGDAHRCGVIHRNLRSSAVQLEARTGGGCLAKVKDFGFAALKGQGAAEAADQPVLYWRSDSGDLGLPEYACPEAGRGLVMDHRSDIYAFGVLFFEMLSGVLPFSGDNRRALLLKHRHQRIPSFDRRAPDVAVLPELESIVHRCMAKEPDDRPQSMLEVAAALTEALPDPRRRPWLRRVELSDEALRASDPVEPMHTIRMPLAVLPGPMVEDEVMTPYATPPEAAVGSPDRKKMGGNVPPVAALVAQTAPLHPDIVVDPRRGRDRKPRPPPPRPRPAAWSDSATPSAGIAPGQAAPSAEEPQVGPSDRRSLPNAAPGRPVQATPRPTPVAPPAPDASADGHEASDYPAPPPPWAALAVPHGVEDPRPTPDDSAFGDPDPFFVSMETELEERRAPDTSPPGPERPSNLRYALWVSLVLAGAAIGFLLGLLVRG